MEEKIIVTDENLTQALEDARAPYIKDKAAEYKLTNTELVRRAMQEHPDWSNTQMAMELGLTPKTVGTLRCFIKKKSETKPAKPEPRKSEDRTPELLAKVAAQKTEIERLLAENKALDDKVNAMAADAEKMAALRAANIKLFEKVSAYEAELLELIVAKHKKEEA